MYFKLSDPIIECVVNISEGHDEKKVYSIAKVVESIPNVKLLHVDIGYDVHRSVVTFAGFPEQVIQAAYLLIKEATEKIDMAIHKGAHARIGAVDVCPFVPIRNFTKEELIPLVDALAKKVGEELHIPIYLYEHSAKHAERKLLANIRKGQYEGLKEKLSDPKWQPDYGPNKFNPKSGATVMGVRDLLIAFNISLNTNDVTIAKKIAATIRETGYQGKPGLFKGLRSIGWHMPSFGCAQVSMNITDINATPIFQIFDKISDLAESLGTTVKGSEPIGLIPFSVFTTPSPSSKRRGNVRGKQNASPPFEGGLPTGKAGVGGGSIENTITHLKLSSLKKFIPEERILEYCIYGLT